jgi:hypothetical protein
MMLVQTKVSIAISVIIALKFGKYVSIGSSRFGTRSYNTHIILAYFTDRGYTKSIIGFY